MLHPLAVTRTLATVLFVSLIASAAQAGTKPWSQDRPDAVKMCSMPTDEKKEKERLCKPITSEEACLMLEDRCWVGDFIGEKELQPSPGRQESQENQIPAKFFHLIAAHAPRTSSAPLILGLSASK